MIAFACAVFTSAFLVFQVQPVVARFILPWFGGTPAVWTTCLQFFQVGLLCGYGYAHLLASRVPLARQPVVHLVLVVVSMLLLPITPEYAGAATGAQAPVLQILLLLAGAVGFPFVMLSASAPLLQHWFANVHPTSSPFRMYALSNLGSLVALLSYPLVVEPAIALATQAFAWSIGYVVFAAVSLWCAWPILSKRLEKIGVQDDAPGKPTTWSERIIWTVLAGCGSTVLLATTNQMSQDIAVTPFLWVLPLSLYLVTFIICFERDDWYIRPLWIPFFILCVGALVVLLHRDYMHDEISLGYQIAIYTSAMFACCMICHGEMVRRRPAAAHLTTFYLYVALGGALGGVFVSLVAPLLFDGFWELHLGLLATAVLAGLCIVTDRNALPVRLRFLSISFWIIGVVTLAFHLGNHAASQRDDSIVNMRGFYGVLHVYEDEVGSERHSRTLYHGRIRHGQQWQAQGERTRPTAYYGTNSGTGIAINYHPARQTATGQLREGMRVGIIGLGVGTIAAYGKQGDTFRFYEINSQTEKIARKYFSYLEQGNANNEVVIGDGRISLAREFETNGSQRFDVLVVDAFSGDAIPIHLLTREAADLYWRHLKEDGILALHVTNIYVDLIDVARQLATYSGRTALHIEDYGDNYYESSNEWVLITNNGKFLQDWRVQNASTAWETKAKPILWTDDFSNLFEIVDW